MPRKRANRLPWLLLPGLDGSAELFDEFVQCRPRAEVHLVRYPLDSTWQLDDYVAHAETAARAIGPCMVLAESFSGPIALRLARRCESVAAIVWVASFLRCPNPLLRSVPLDVVGARVQRWITSTPLVRLMCLDFDVTPTCVRTVQQVVRALPIEVLRSRLRLLRDLDPNGALDGLDKPWFALTASRDRLVVTSSFPSESAGASNRQRRWAALSAASSSGGMLATNRDLAGVSMHLMELQFQGRRHTFMTLLEAMS